MVFSSFKCNLFAGDCSFCWLSFRANYGNGLHRCRQFFSFFFFLSNDNECDEKKNQVVVRLKTAGQHSSRSMNINTGIIKNLTIIIIFHKTKFIKIYQAIARWRLLRNYSCIIFVWVFILLCAVPFLLLCYIDKGVSVACYNSNYFSNTAAPSQGHSMNFPSLFISSIFTWIYSCLSTQLYIFINCTTICCLCTKAWIKHAAKEIQLNYNNNNNNNQHMEKYVLELVLALFVVLWAGSTRR